MTTRTTKHSPAANKALSRRIIEEAWNQHQAQALARFYAATYVNHRPAPGYSPDRAGLQQWLAACVAAFPDLQVTIEELIAEGDRVVTRWVAHGTYWYAGAGRVHMQGVTVARIAGGLVVEEWVYADEPAAAPTV